MRGVDTGRMKNPTILCMIGEVYEHEKLYEHANCFSFKYCTLFDDEDSARLYYEVNK